MPTVTIRYYGTDEGGDYEADINVPCEYAVCRRCHGEGKHVNPNVDGHGLTREDFEADPDFAEMYMAGVYDVVCHDCGGNRVTPELPDENAEHLDEEQRDAIRQHNKRVREVEYERRMRERGIEY